MFNLPGWLFTVIALVLTLFVIGLIFARLYRRASAEQAAVASLPESRQTDTLWKDAPL